MRKTLTILACVGLLAPVLAPGAAEAGRDCLVPMADWQPREAVARLATEQGWTIRRIKIDDGCYEVKGSDATGRPIEAKIHPGTLVILEIEFEDEKDHDHHHRKPETTRDEGAEAEAPKPQ